MFLSTLIHRSVYGCFCVSYNESWLVVTIWLSKLKILYSLALCRKSLWPLCRNHGIWGKHSVMPLFCVMQETWASEQVVTATWWHQFSEFLNVADYLVILKSVCVCVWERERIPKTQKHFTYSSDLCCHTFYLFLYQLHSSDL